MELICLKFFVQEAIQQRTLVHVWNIKTTIVTQRLTALASDEQQSISKKAVKVNCILQSACHNFELIS
jgi:hypothetical protein